LSARINTTARRALQIPALAAYAVALTTALGKVDATTRAAWSTANPLEALPNAVPYMQAFGHTVLAWIGLDVALTAQATNATHSIAAYAGFIRSNQYFYHYELPKIDAWLGVVGSRDMTCAHMPEDAF
jgi:threonine/homoserine/homoserine lactone efflux protein